MPFRIPKDYREGWLSFIDRDPFVEEVASYSEWLKAEIKLCSAYLKAHKNRKRPMPPPPPPKPPNVPPPKPVPPPEPKK